MQSVTHEPLSQSEQTRQVIQRIADLADSAEHLDHGNLVAAVRLIGARARSIKITRWCHQCGEWPMEPDDADRMCAACRDEQTSREVEDARETAESDRHDTVMRSWA